VPTGFCAMPLLPYLARAAGEMITPEGWARVLMKGEKGSFRVKRTVDGSTTSVLAMFLYRL